MDVTPTPENDLAHELDRVEHEVNVLAVGEDPATGRRLCELAAREYEILEALTRPWRQP